MGQSLQKENVSVTTQWLHILADVLMTTSVLFFNWGMEGISMKRKKELTKGPPDGK